MPEIGPTNEFPFGVPKMPQDRGGLNVGVHVNRQMRMIIMEFGTTTNWLCSPRKQALEMAEQFRSMVTNAFGPLPYNASTLPIKVTANIEKQIVESRLPKEVSVLAANPEMFLGWADKIEEAAKKLTQES